MRLMNCRFLHAAVLLLALRDVHAQQVAEAATASASGRLILIADPQIHNPFGLKLKQQTWFANAVSRVAVRPAELNLLAPLVLRHAVNTHHAIEPLSTPMLVLGDGTNIGCTGEWDVFESTLDLSAPNRLWFMAHGNHDSYMIGTMNAYSPMSDVRRNLDSMRESAFPFDQSLWADRDQPAVSSQRLRYLNWGDSCAQPAFGDRAVGSPMNKVSWIAKYLAHLSKAGLQLHATGTSRDSGRQFVGRATPNSRLAAVGFRLYGLWYAPQDELESDLTPLWESFVVQVFDLDSLHTVLILDTSVCPLAAGGTSIFKTNSGSKACVGSEQFALIDDALKSVDASRRVTFAGHFPLSEFREADRDSLIRLMRSRSPGGWTYLSGHTHERRGLRRFANGVDLNIGSTTDWPMESHRVSLDDDLGVILPQASLTLGDDIVPITYRGPRNDRSRYSELCRHLAVAQRLAGSPDLNATRWRSPDVTRDQCENIDSEWRTRADSLRVWQLRIAQRFDADSAFRHFVLRLAVGASKKEADEFQLFDIIR